MDVRLLFGTSTDLNYGFADISLEDGIVEQGHDLETAVIISLLSWRRANDEDALPTGDSDRKGWWGDSYRPRKLGSRLWLLRREKLTDETIARAREYCEEALRWLVEDGVATDLGISVQRTGTHSIGVEITIHRNGARTTTLRYDNIWEAYR